MELRGRAVFLIEEDGNNDSFVDRKKKRIDYTVTAEVKY